MLASPSSRSLVLKTLQESVSWTSRSAARDVGKSECGTGKGIGGLGGDKVVAGAGGVAVGRAWALDSSQGANLWHFYRKCLGGFFLLKPSCCGQTASFVMMR